jgi:hypothetical protein
LNPFFLIDMKTKIIFLPFKGLYGKSINNIIILNERLLNDTYINSKTLIHETLHLWWGDNSTLKIEL